MTDFAQEAGKAVEGAVETGVQKAEQLGQSVITKIATGALTVWHEVEAEIDADYAKVKNVLPSSATPTLAATVSDLKQSASDTLSLVSKAGAAVAPAVTKGVEALANTALAGVSNGMALPLVPMVDAGIEELASLGIAAWQAWALKTKAQLATTTKAS